jgi:hypothetical protein
MKAQCTPSKQRRVSRWEHEEVLERVQQRLDENPQAMRQRRETVEHPFGTIKMRMGATHFLMKRLKNVRTEMALSVQSRQIAIKTSEARGDPVKSKFPKRFYTTKTQSSLYRSFLRP